MAAADSPAGAEPPSRRLAALLREGIRTGRYTPGERLPTERALAVEHGIARNTAAAAIRILVGEGLVDTQRGSGAYVRGAPRLTRVGAGRYSRRLRAGGLSPFRAEVVAQGRTPAVDCVSITRVVPPIEVSTRLRLTDSGDVVRRENHYYVDGAAVQLGVTWAAWSLVEGSPISYSAHLGPGSIYARFEDLGHVVARSLDEVSARMPIPEEIGMLDLPAGVPVLELSHTSIDQHGEPFETTTFVMRADRIAVAYDIPIDHGDEPDADSAGPAATTESR